MLQQHGANGNTERHGQLRRKRCAGCAAGRKSRIESFAGAVETFTIEAMMGDGKALQVCAAPTTDSVLPQHDCRL